MGIGGEGPRPQDLKAGAQTAAGTREAGCSVNASRGPVSLAD